MRIAFDRPADQVSFDGGEIVRATIVLNQRQDVLWLPTYTLRMFQGREFIVVQTGELQERVDVLTGIRGDGRVEIVEGVAEGELVVGQ